MWDLIVSVPDHCLSFYLVDMQAFTSFNKGFRYILTVIDVFSKYVWAVITETSPYSFDNFRKLSLYNCFMPI